MGLLPPLRSSPCCITPVILIAALAQACPATFPGHVTILPFFQSLCTTQRVCTLTVASSLRFQNVFCPHFPRRLIAAECPIPLISEYLLLAPALRRTGDTLGTEPERTLSFHPARAIGSKAHRLMRMDNWTYGSCWVLYPGSGDGCPKRARNCASYAPIVSPSRPRASARRRVILPHSLVQARCYY